MVSLISVSNVIFSILMMQIVATHHIKEQIKLISKSNLFVDISFENTYVDPGAICVHGLNESKAIAKGEVYLSFMGHYPITYTCPYGTESTRHVVVGPAVCYMLWYPVCCGTKTYSNDCEANADACFIHQEGECNNEYCTIVDCVPGFEKVGMDKKGCGGKCVHKEQVVHKEQIVLKNRLHSNSRYDTVTSIVLIVFGSSIFLGIYLLLITIRSTHK
tara:strand:- start:6123 stop:6773 length:651 start_codon:yes stop_codon:yes gene_type:complete